MSRSFLRDAGLLIASIRILPHRFRPIILRSFHARIGSPVLLYGGLIINSGAELLIENDVFVSHICYFDLSAQITIRSGVSIGDHVRLITSTHEIGGPTKRAGSGRSAAIEIGRGSWLGSGVCILPGVTIGEGCVIGAQSLVTRSTAPHGVYLGTPARRVRELRAQP